MEKQISGIHHVTAIAKDPQQNLDFYAGVLGLRLVKKTVNFDDPETYHFYFGDRLGNPGTILTFFPIPLAYQGQPGSGQVTTTGLVVPPDSLAYWGERLEKHGVRVDRPFSPFGEQAMAFYDPDGMQLELVAHGGESPGQPWPGSPVPAEHQIRAVHNVRLTERMPEPTVQLLTETLGFRLRESAGNLYRYEAGAGGAAAYVDILVAPGAQPGRVAAGSVHHVAFRAEDDGTQAAWRESLLALGYNVSPVMDRSYFRSIYFREPGGVLFEIATDAPGFTLDEDETALGEALKLPSWFEQARGELERRLPKVRRPDAGAE